MPCRVRFSNSTVIDVKSKTLLEEGFRVWISGESGSGKSSATALILEQVLSQGGQVLCCDPHGEYGNMWSVNPGTIERIGYGGSPVEDSSIDWCVDILRSGKSLFIDFSHWAYSYPERLDAFVLNLMREVFALRRSQPRWTLIVLEEAQNFIPQNQSPGQYGNIKTFLSMLNGGRNFGLQFILTSQRPSLVDVNALSACSLKLFLRVSEIPDWKRIKAHVPKSLGLTFNDGLMAIKNFRTGRAIMLSRWTSDAIIQLRQPTVQLRKPLMDAENGTL